MMRVNVEVARPSSSCRRGVPNEICVYVFMPPPFTTRQRAATTKRKDGLPLRSFQVFYDKVLTLRQARA